MTGQIFGTIGEDHFVLKVSLCYSITDHDEVGWKIIHADVFRFPPYKSWLCAILGKLCFLIPSLNRTTWDLNHSFKVSWKLLCAFGNFLWLARYLLSIHHAECSSWWWPSWAWLMYISRVMYITEVLTLAYLLLHRCRIPVPHTLLWYHIFGFVGLV